MHPREIIELQRERPFVGLRIYISDGSSYEITHPEMMLVMPGRVYIALPPLKDGVPTGGSVYCDPVHVTRIEPLNGRKRSAKGRQRKVE